MGPIKVSKSGTSATIAAIVCMRIKTGIFGQLDPKVHLGQAWRIEFQYRNINEY